MWKYESKKRAAYYERAVKLYYEEQLGCRKIAQIFSLSKNTISNYYCPIKIVFGKTRHHNALIISNALWCFSKVSPPLE